MMKKQQKSVATFVFNDLLKEPIKGLHYQIRNKQGRVVADGRTNSKGESVKISRDVGTVLHVYVKRIISPDMKEIATVTLSSEAPRFIFRSPKILIKGLSLFKHEAPKGVYKRKTYKVKSGDTLSGIAQHHGTTVSEVALLNHIKDKDVIAEGQMLKLPVAKPKSDKAPSHPAATTPQASTPHPAPAQTTNATPSVTAPTSVPVQQSAPVIAAPPTSVIPSPATPEAAAPPTQQTPPPTPVQITQQNSATTGSPVAVIDANPPPSVYPLQTPTIAPWMVIAKREAIQWAGVSEGRIGDNYHQLVGYNGYNLNTAWCAAFVNYCVQQVGYPKANNPLGALSIENSSTFRRVNIPIYGAIAIWRDPVHPGRGHACFVYGILASNNNKFIRLGGNQGDRITADSRARSSYRFYVPASYYSQALNAPIAPSKTLAEVSQQGISVINTTSTR